MKTNELTELFYRHFPFMATADQERAIFILSRFILTDKKRACFLLKGYAGTGKTSLMTALGKTVRSVNMKVFQMSPTGRAAKVLQTYTGKKAFTIHKSIYFRQVAKDGSAHFVLKKNQFTNTIFVVDEASMITNMPGSSSMTEEDLLTDLIKFVYSGANCKLLIIGDQAQLPPVHLEHSPALDKDLLMSRYNLTIAEFELKQVMRQEMDSGILGYATSLRDCLREENLDIPVPEYDKYTDLQAITYESLQEEIEKCIAEYGIDNVKILSRSNKTANAYNGQIRKEVMWHDDELSAGDHLMIVKNNYFWIKDNADIGFLANGDLMEVLKLSNQRELYGLTFCDALIKLTDYPDEEAIEVKLILESLLSEGPSLSSEKMNELYHNVRADYTDLGSNQKIKEALRQDPYLNALQVKFAYAITCHKAQGGQWPVIFIDRGYFLDDMIDKSYLRWLYTAVTRSTKKLFFVNFEKLND